MYKPTDLELAWISGFFDGEGCFSTSLQGMAVKPRITITQKRREPLDFIHSAFGGAIRPHGMSVWGLYVESYGEMYVFTEAMLPYLRLKKAEAVLFFELLALKEARDNSRRQWEIRELLVMIKKGEI